jgi:outer membrane protein OmpA-like peptidoglycan-associated protein
MKLLKTSTLILCMTVSACSSHKADSDADAGGGSWWPFGKKETVAEKKIEMPDPKITTAWLDEYEPRLRDALKDSKFEVERRDSLLVVTAPVDTSFNKDRPEMLLPASLGPVTKVAKLVEADPKTAVLVLGHADGSGTGDVNLSLSQKRAQAVAAIFRLSGLKGDRLILKGVGSDMPRAANDSAAGRSLNRRVEIMLTPQDTLLALVAKYNQPVAATAAPTLDANAPKLAVADKPKVLAAGQAK